MEEIINKIFKEKYPKGLSAEYTKEEMVGYMMAINDIKEQLFIHVVGSGFYTLEEWGQGSPNRGVLGTYKTREDAEKDRTDNYWQHIKEHKFK